VYLYTLCTFFICFLSQFFLYNVTHNLILLFFDVVVILAENRAIQDKLLYYDLRVETIAEAAPIQLYAASVLSDLFAHLGSNSSLLIFIFYINCFRY